MCLFLRLLIIATAVMAINAEVDCDKPPHVEFNKCCEVSDVISEKVKDKCGLQMSEANDFGPPRDHHHGPPAGIRGGPHKFGPHYKMAKLFNQCFLSCVVNETGILVDGELQEANVNSYLKELFGEVEKVEFVSNQFRICDDRRKDFNTKWPKHNNTPSHYPCNQDSKIIKCVRVETFKDCPDSFWSNTDECNELRDHFNQCWHFEEKSDVKNSEVNMEEAEEI